MGDGIIPEPADTALDDVRDMKEGSIGAQFLCATCVSFVQHSTRAATGALLAAGVRARLSKLESVRGALSRRPFDHCLKLEIVARLRDQRYARVFPLPSHWKLRVREPQFHLMLRSSAHRGGNDIEHFSPSSRTLSSTFTSAAHLRIRIERSTFISNENKQTKNRKKGPLRGIMTSIQTLSLLHHHTTDDRPHYKLHHKTRTPIDYRLSTELSTNTSCK